VATRRGFLGTAGSAVVYQMAGSPPPLKAAGANDQIGFGYIGCGIRQAQLMNEFKRVPGVRSLFCCDLYDGCLERSREQLGADVAVTKDYTEVLNRKDVDAVVIATPDHWHKRMVLDALAAGKHVYIEKPMTWSIDEGPEIIKAVEKSGKLLQVGSQGKTSALAAKAKELIAGGAIGKVNMVRMSNHRNDPQGAWVYPVPPDASEKTIDWARFHGPAPKKPFDPKIFFRWRCWWDYSGGVATDLFVHLLTWLHEVMGVTAPVAAASTGGIWRWHDGRNVPDVMNSIFEYAENFIADIYVNLGNSYGGGATVIMGSEGTLALEREGLVHYRETAQPDVQSYGTLSWPKAMRESYFESHGWTPQGRPRSPLPQRVQRDVVKVEEGPSHYELFVVSLRDNKPSRETAAEGHYAAGAAHLANMAYRKGRRMTWDWKNGKVREA
jgi:predicted dehydrogenase